MYYPVDKYIYSMNNAGFEGSSVEKHEEDGEDKRRKYETLVAGLAGGYTL
jgi:hypothetical protein